MGRYSKHYSYSHRIKEVEFDCYKISWVIDFYYANSRLRYPRVFSRITDSKGAKRFRKKWGIC